MSNMGRRPAALTWSNSRLAEALKSFAKAAKAAGEQQRGMRVQAERYSGSLCSAALPATAAGFACCACRQEG